MKSLLFALMLSIVGSQVFAGGYDVNRYCCPKPMAVERFVDFINCKEKNGTVSQSETPKALLDLDSDKLGDYNCEEKQEKKDSSSFER